ncbi:MAG: hypothetical protein EAZ75_09575 [Flavobacteriia bacterium]|nr:MAG: hypothetical protein EAZ75_09575 [Flavobacteriia bacterium]
MKNYFSLLNAMFKNIKTNIFDLLVLLFTLKYLFLILDTNKFISLSEIVVYITILAVIIQKICSNTKTELVRIASNPFFKHIKICCVLFVLVFFSNDLIAQGTTCSTATPLTINGACVAGTINDSTQDTPIASGCSFNTFRREGWYSFTVTGGPLNITITADAANRDLFLQLISSSNNTCGGTLTQINCANATQTNGAQTETITSILANGTYYIKVINNRNNNDMILNSICVTSFADDCNNAIPLTINTSSCSYSNYTTVGATDSTSPSIPPMPGCASYTGGDVWFSFVVPANGKVTIDTQSGGLTDSGMAWYTGSCSGLTLLECNDDDSANGLMSSITRTDLIPGTTIYVRFWEYSNDNQGTFGICATSPTPPVNDICSGAISLTSSTICTTTTGSTFGATDNNETGDCTQGTAEEAVWYSFVAVSTSHVVTVDGAADIDSVLGVISSCGSTVIPTGGDCIDVTFDDGIETRTLTNLTIGNTYYIQVYDYWGIKTANAFTICVTHIPPAISSLTTSSSCVGSSLVINGTNLSNATSVTIGGTAAAITANTPNSITVTVGSGTTGTVIVTTPGGSATSSNTFTVNPILYAGVSIASNDADNVICAGTSVTFTATPTNGGVAPTYQWFVNGSAVSGQTNTTFTSTTLANNNIVTVRMTSNATPCLTGSPATSSGITMTVNPVLPASVSVASNDADNTICAGTSVTFTATPTNGGTAPTYQWFVNGSAVSGQTNTTFTSTTLTNNNVVTVRMTSNAIPCLTGSSVTSTGITMIVNPIPTATISGNNGTICNNGTATFTIAGTNGAVVTYTINSGANQTITLTSGAATVTIPNVIANQTLNLVSVSLGSCTASLSNSSTVTVGAVATWNGTTWSPTRPAANMGIVFNGTYTTSGTIEGCNCTINSGNVTIASGDTMLLSNELIVIGGTFTVENNANLIQTNNVTNSGNITYKRTSPLTVNTSDYVYWATPVSGQTVPSGWNYFWDNAASTSGNWIAASGQVLTAGKGVIMRGVGTKNFTGVPFNGEISVNVYRRAIGGYDDNWNLIGNPYPSAISADEFLGDLDNTAIEGSIAIWTHGSAISSNNPNPFYSTFTYNYNPEDYIIYNTFADQTGPSSFGGNIAAGQGFFLKYDETAPTAASSTIKFKNSMRTDASGNSYGNSQFYRSSQSIEKHRIWLDFINGGNPATSRTVVGYADLATAGKDRLFDASTTITASNAKMYSLIGMDKMSIQAKGLPFTDQETIPIGYNAPQAGNYTVAIHAVDGLFATQNIYLEDTQLNLTHDIKLAPYTFTATQGENNTRFILRFTNQTLGNEDFSNENAITVYTNDVIHIATTNQTIKSVRVYDLLGRVLGTFNKVNSTSFTCDKIQKTQSTLIVKVTLENGFVKTYKIIF